MYHLHLFQLQPRRYSSKTAPPPHQNCGICDSPLNDGRQIHAKGGNHSECLSARQCIDRMEPDTIASIRKLRDMEPDTYRAVVKSLCVAPGVLMTAQQRKSVRTFIVEMGSEASFKKKSKTLMLSRRQYIAWHVHHELFSVAEAEAKWEARPSLYRFGSL